jgi:chromosome segregation protein
MRLKSLELLGFKSFLEPTIISFSPGVTAVVGPNGCGKSNVVDAIRWVLGEQAPTRLRGKSAEDLIYAGNDANQPAGLAEVTLLLEAEEGNILPEPYSALSEVAVTRRVYRSGDSEYLINRIPCRLKDITEFFMAAQIHSRGYALIEQGRIDEIIQAKPAEIRTMVEEAAGLSLFKGRREIGERKLERVRENLARVDDVLSEIERQLNFARRQAKKAEAYKLIRSELVELEKLAAARRLLEQNAELAQQSARELELREKAEAARAEARSLQDEADLAAAALTAARDELAAAGRDLENLRAAFEERGRTRGFLERRLGAIAELEPSLELRLSELDVKATAARAARAHASARLARALNWDDGTSEAALAVLRENHEKAERALRECEKYSENRKDELAELMREAAVTRGRLGDLAGERAELEQRLDDLSKSRPELIAVVSQSREQVGIVEAALTEARDEVARRETIQRETSEHELDLRTILANHEARVTAAGEALTTAKARAQQIVPNGAGEKLRNVLESLNGDRPAADPAMLLDVVKAPPALETALRAVLGEELDAVIIDSPYFAIRAIEILKQSEGGRLSFIHESIAPTLTHAPIEAPGIAGRLLDMVEVEPRFISMAESLMGHVMVADDLRAALAASDLNGYGTVFVTREGDLLWPNRLISGGSGRQVESDTAADMRERERSLAVAQRVVVEAEADHEDLIRRYEWARLAYQDDIDALKAARARVIEAEHAANDCRAALAKAEQQLALIEANRANAERRIAEVATAATAANARLEDLARLEQGARAHLRQAATDLADRRTETRKLGDAMLEAGAKVEARKASLNALEQELRHQRRIADELEGQIEQHRGEIDRARLERAEFDRELATLAEQDELASDRRRELEKAVADLRTQCEEREHEVESARDALKNAREASETLEAEAMQCNLRRERACTLIEELERSFREKFQAEFAEAANDLGSTLMGRDVQKDDERLRDLRLRAEKIGEVNLAAESEVKELEERAGTLQAERADLQNAVNDLTHTIQRLNREARKRFAETFEGAARNFTELFPKLLRGGKGRLELTSADDVLEAGVNILVQPAGKKVKEIGLLSGGEKALSAMALIFSLFLLNPSPFCVMDEVDAPLDEFSLAAFTGLVRELKTRSQFIIITHNQRTMQAADNIHGVTMERPGISRIISLKIPAAA